eukprot:gene2351-3079_t
MEGVSYRSPDEENPAFLELVDVSSTEACHEACLWMEGCAFFTMLMLTEASISGYLCNLWTADAVAFVTAEYGPISGPKVCPGNEAQEYCRPGGRTCVSRGSLGLHVEATEEMRSFMHAHGYSGYVSPHITLPLNDTCPSGSALLRGLAYFPNATSRVTWGIRDADGVLSPLAHKEPGPLVDASHAFCLSTCMEGVYSVETISFGGCRPEFLLDSFDPREPRYQQVEYYLGEEGSMECVCGEKVNDHEECAVIALAYVYDKLEEISIRSYSLEEDETLPPGCHLQFHATQNALDAFQVVVFNNVSTFNGTSASRPGIKGLPFCRVAGFAARVDVVDETGCKVAHETRHLPEDAYGLVATNRTDNIIHLGDRRSDSYDHAEIAGYDFIAAEDCPRDYGLFDNRAVHGMLLQTSLPTKEACAALCTDNLHCQSFAWLPGPRPSPSPPPPPPPPPPSLPPLPNSTDYSSYDHYDQSSTGAWHCTGTTCG